jgi:hypothetical protein
MFHLPGSFGAGLLGCTFSVAIALSRSPELGGGEAASERWVKDAGWTEDGHFL